MKAHPDGQIVEGDLMETNLPFVSAPWLQAYFTPSGMVVDLPAGKSTIATSSVE